MKIIILVCVGVVLLITVNCAASEEPMMQRKRTFKKNLTQKQIVKTGSDTYYLTLPGEYHKDTKRWPLIMFLHGAGGQIEGRRAMGPPKISRMLKDFPFIVLTPMSGRPRGWRNEYQMGVLNTLLNEVIANYRVDKNRIYLTGLSMGGYGTWAMAMKYPRRFAAIAPICGGSKPAEASKIKHLPIWTFHCVKDQKIPIRRSEEMVRALKKLGSDVKFTRYPLGGFEGNTHDAWSRTYTNPEFYEWLLKHRKTAGDKIVTEELDLDPQTNKSPWVSSLIRFRRLLFAKLRDRQGFTGMRGKDPQRGLRFSLPIRNQFASEMHVAIDWDNDQGAPWTVTTDPPEATVAPGEEVKFRFTANSKGTGRLFPRPVCNVKFTAGKDKGLIRIDLPLDVPLYLQNNRPTLVARAAKVAPAIDGKLDDAVWSGEPDVTDFQVSNLGSVPTVSTDAWVTYDKKYCYVAMRCHEPQMDQLKIVKDGNIWEGDSVEIILDTAPERKDARYYFVSRWRKRKVEPAFRFVVNPLGAMFDEQVYEEPFDSAGVKVATAKTKSAWTVEIAIPWTDIKMHPPAKGTKMAFVLARYRYPKDGDKRQDLPESLQYPPLNGDSERRECYGDLTFE